MARQDGIRITRRTVDALGVEAGDAVFWDRDLRGFGVRVHASGRKAYVVQTRGPCGRLKRVTLGRDGRMTAEEARKSAAQALDRIRQGEAPFPEPPAPEPTVADLAARYIERHVRANCKPATIRAFRGAVEHHILPALGGMRLSEVDRSHVSDLHVRMRDMPAQANLTFAVLAKMFRLAEAWGMTPPRPNPCRSVRRYRETKRERFLSPEEYRRLGRVLAEAEAGRLCPPSAVAAIRLLALTGCRKSEIVALRWDDVDRTSGEIRIRDGKTGPRRIPLTPAAERVLGGIDRAEGSPWVIAGQDPDIHLKGLDRIWRRLRARAGLEDVRVHDLRHSYASRALAVGETLPTIGRLLGHGKVRTTARYAHLQRDTERASAANVGGSIGADILNGRDGEAA